MQLIVYIALIFIAMVVPTMSFCTITTTTRCLVGRHIRRRHHSTNAPSRLPTTKYTAIYSSQRIMPLVRPQDPTTFTDDDVHNQAQILRQWMLGKKSILCISGAGMSTESNIPDYRGSNGSYFRGHKPIIHHEFMNSQSRRQKYWSRSLVGYSAFSNAEPNKGHRALAWLEEENYIGVNLEKCTAYDQLSQSCFGSKADEKKRLSVITQNVDSLHSAGGLKYCMHLHGRGDLVECQNCGHTQDRMEYHKQLAQHNEEWLSKARAKSKSIDQTKDQRPDGDVEIDVSSEELVLPSCPSCGDHHTKTDGVHNPSFFKTSVVFFGDSVPKHRFDIANAAIDKADGVLCLGTSLAVHSAFRLVKRSIVKDIPVAILNVGETRIEKEGIGNGLVTKLESPIGETLDRVVKLIDTEKQRLQ